VKITGAVGVRLIALLEAGGQIMSIEDRMLDEMVYLRDASFLNCPGHSGRYHFFDENRNAMCGQMMMPYMETGTHPSEVPAVLRCRRNGCRQLWKNHHC
jgi:hypothetical protein